MCPTSNAASSCLTTPCPSEVLRTWRNYQRGGDLRFRDHLVLMFLPMVRRITYRKIRELPAQCDAEDLLSRGTEALIRAIDRYDPGKGATLEQYAWTRVQGAVLDELRDQDWAPRSLRRDERAINLARERLIAGHQHHPNREQLARAVGMTTTKLARRLDELVLVDIASLNQPVGSDDAATIERVDTLVSVDESSEPVAHAERSEAKDACREAFRLLNPQQREVAVLLYTNDWTLREVGERLGVSESRVCQIHARLRECLQLHSELSLLASVG